MIGHPNFKSPIAWIFLKYFDQVKLQLIVY